jgi:DNA-binding NarL/FixJ family response regulator
MSPLPYAPAIALEVDRHGAPVLVPIMSAPIRVLIADAQPIVRAGFAAMLEVEDDMAVAGAAASVDEAVALVCELRPDVALFDLELPGGGGLEAARRVEENPHCADVNVMILAAHDDDDELFAALRAGARGYLLKSTEPGDLMQAVRVVASGEALLSPSATRRLITEFASQPQPQVPSAEQLDELTAREREVIALVAAGLRNDEIAERFVISPATVKTHVSRALRKLDARDRAQLVAIAYQLGLVRPGARRTLRAVPEVPSLPAVHAHAPRRPTLVLR